MASDDGKPKGEIKTSRLRRGLRLGGAAARLGGQLAKARVRAALTGTRQLDEGSDAGHKEAAARLRDTLGDMKGAALKVGQLLSYVDSDLPVAYQELLSGLQSNAPPMNIALVHQVIEDELGQPPEALFETFDDTPLAAASIGQVHRARLKDGREAVVKVQYPGIRDAIRADIGNARALFALGQVAFRNVDRGELEAELLEVMLEECDYGREATNQATFREIWRAHPGIDVPEVYGAYSSGRVLTSEYIQGLRFDEFLQSASQAQKNRAGYAMLEFMLTSFFDHGLFNGDPHPGNYLFRTDGSVVFLDYGCVKQISAETRADFRAFFRAVVQGDEAALMSALRRLGYIPPGVEMSAAAWMKVERYVQRPWLRDEVFTFTPEYIRGVWPLLLKEPEMRKTGLPQEFLFFNRLQWGLYAVLTKLSASNNYHQIVRGWV